MTLPSDPNAFIVRPYPKPLVRLPGIVWVIVIGFNGLAWPLIFWGVMGVFG